LDRGPLVAETGLNLDLLRDLKFDLPVEEIRMDQISFGFSGGFWPRRRPLFQT
jgi:hypothetical protein